MKIFVSGATGVIGNRAVQRLAEAGRHVTGVARTDEKAASLRQLLPMRKSTNSKIS